MKKTDLAYTGGIIDGEGCISIRQYKRGKYPNYILYVDVGSSDEWLPMWLKFAYGGSVQGYIKKGGNYLWRWTVTTRQAKSFLELILPYLKLKRGQAEIAIGFQSRKHYHGRTAIPKSQYVLEEADAILLKSMHNVKLRQADNAN